jgi:uncharacterized protein YceK
MIIMRIIINLLTLFAIVSLPAGCSTVSQTSSTSEPQSQVMNYDENSWKTMIPDSCLSYFDGCNNCRRNAAGEAAACTRKACFKYRKPECLDDAQ